MASGLPPNISSRFLGFSRGCTARRYPAQASVLQSASALSNATAAKSGSSPSQTMGLRSTSRLAQHRKEPRRMTEPARILLVEDNAADVYLFRKAMTNAELNYELTVIEDGGGAMMFIRAEGRYAGSPVPDLAIIDLSLPKNDGIQVVEAIRQEERFADVPVV